MMLLIIIAVISYIMMGIIAFHIINEYTNFGEDTCVLFGAIWPLVVPILLFMKFSSLVKKVVKGEKFKKLLIFKGSSGTITVNTKVTGR